MYTVSFCDSTDTSPQFFIMNATQYWPFAREYSIWNIAVTALQIWMADLDPQTYSNAIEWVYTALFCSNSAQQLKTISEEVLFGHFVSTLNNTFERELTLRDKEYKSGSESLNIPTPLHRMSCLYCISVSENSSFRPATPLTHQAYSLQQQSSLNSVCHCLTFSNDDDSSIDSSPLHGRTEQSSPVEHQMAHHLTTDSFQDVPSEEEEEAEEHFPTAPLDDDVWMEEPVPDRHLCIHEQSQAHDLCPYPCLYSLDQLHPTPKYAPAPQHMDLSNSFNFPDVMITTSDEDIPRQEDFLDFEYEQ